MKRFHIALALVLAACVSTPSPVPEATYGSNFQPLSQDLEAVILALIEGAPPARALGVQVLVGEIPAEEHALGVAWESGAVGELELWTIMIESRMCPTLQAHVLVHEWAHVLQGDSGTCFETDHGPLFGVLWAEAWRAYTGEGFEEEEAPIEEPAAEGEDG